MLRGCGSIALLEVFLVLITCGNCLAENSLSTDDKCRENGVEIKVKQGLATAGLWANFRKSKNSLRYQTKHLLKKAVYDLPGITVPKHGCEGNCILSGSPEIVFDSWPSKLKSNYKDKQKCIKLLASTKKQPIIFSNKQFSSVDEFEEWFSDFSQGKGQDGGSLYKQCDGECSPQYHSLLTIGSGSEVTAEVRVTCSHARDKGDNNYNLAYGYRWECRSRENGHP